MSAGNPVMSPHNPMCEVLASPAISMLMTTIRAKDTPQRKYVEAADRLMNLLAEEGLARLATKTQVTTPCGTCDGLAAPDGHQICAVDIIRSGGILLEAVRRLCPELKTAKVLIQRDEQTSKPVFYYKKFPDGVENLDVILCDPMLATGGSALMAIDCLREAGVPDEKILFLNVLSCPEGLAALAKNAPNVRVLTASVDEKLNNQKFIVPGLGDFGDRYYGTAGYVEGHWGTDGR